MGDANHDVFFRRVFGRPDLAADLWRRLLPPALLDALDLERAERVDGDAVDDALRSRRADLIFRVPLRDSPDRFAFVFLLIEHQSTPHPLMPFRVLVYGVQALSDFIEQYRAEHGRTPTRLPAIIPLVVYQGTRPWSGPRRLGQLFDLPPALADALGAHLPEMALVIDDLARTDDEQIERTTRNALATAALMVMRYVRDEQAPTAFLERWMRHIGAAIDNAEDRPIVELMSAYLYSWSDRLQPEDVVDAIKAAPTPNREVLMNLAQKFEQRGREAGREEGRQAGREEGRQAGREEGRVEAEIEMLRAIVPRMVQLRFGPLDRTTLDRIAVADVPTLKRWCDRAMDAPTLDELLGG